MPASLSVVFQDVSFGYESSPRFLFEELDLHLPRGWIGVVGANGVGKTTLLELATGRLAPIRGVVRLPARVATCAQRTDEPPSGFVEFLSSSARRAWELRGRLAVEDGWLHRWPTLSYGERKRAQLAVALWREPDLLALDEPTNHVDAEVRRLLLGALRSFRGVGLLVSHDRELLDELCSSCVFVELAGVVLRPGGYTEAVAERERETVSARRERATATRERNRTERVVATRRAEAARAQSRLSKRHLNPGDHDARRKIDKARVTGRDATSARQVRPLEERVKRARERERSLAVEKQHEVGVWLPGSRSPRDLVARLAAGSVPLGDDRCLRHGPLAVRPTDRIAITGANGTGKTSLVRRLIAEARVPSEQLVVLPQELDVDATERLLAEVRALSREDLGRVMSFTSRLGTRPERLLDSARPSPGELRKLLLALGATRRPHLIVADEPTNHLDLPAITALEAALSACPCALVLVSHDRRFLDGLATIRWELTVGEDGDTRLDVMQEGRAASGASLAREPTTDAGK